MFTQVCTHAHVHGRCLQKLLSALLFETVSFMEPEDHSARLASQQAGAVFLSLSSQLWGYRCTLLYLASYIISGMAIKSSRLHGMHFTKKVIGLLCDLHYKAEKSGKEHFRE